jgi:hypothetical protein
MREIMSNHKEGYRGESLCSGRMVFGGVGVKRSSEVGFMKEVRISFTFYISRSLLASYSR